MDIGLIEVPVADPVKIQAGYYKGGQYYFDVFLAPPEEVKTPAPVQYKKFTARLQKFAQINILLTKSQVQALGGLEIQDMDRPSLKTDKRINKRFLDYTAQYIECMLPLVKISEPSNLFRIQKFIYGIQVIEDENDENSGEEIVVETEFITQFGFNCFVRGPSWMHMTTTDARNLEPWDLETENLGMLEYEDEGVSNEVGLRQNYDLTKFEKSESESLSLEEVEEEEKVEVEAKIKEIKEWIQEDISVDQCKNLN